MNKKNIILTITILLLTCLIIVGGTFAFFSSTISENNSFNGSTYDFDTNLTMNVVKNPKLVPTVDSLINTSLNGSDSCIGENNYGLCNIYQISLANNSSNSVTFVGDIKTDSGTTYVTNHLKYGLYTLSGSTYTSVSDIGNLAYTANSVNKFKSSNNDFNVTLSGNQSKTYYLVIWLSDIGSNQLEDADKKYLGTVEFVLSSGERLTANFTV